MKSFIKSILITFILSAGFFSVNGQPIPGDPGEQDNPVPITGIEYLIAAGAAFGAKKLYDKKKK
jgi:hypothetical protein